MYPLQLKRIDIIAGGGQYGPAQAPGILGGSGAGAGQIFKAVITDSGGITEETTVMGVPCITPRDCTERPETVDIGTNELIGTDPDQIPPVLDRLFAGKWKKGAVPELWDGRTGERIVKILAEIV